MKMKMRTATRLIFAAMTIWLSAGSYASSAGLFEGRAIHGRGDGAGRIVGRSTRLLTPRAAALIGYQYEHGLGVPQSFEVAVDYYISAAERGDPTGQYLLGLMYDKGHGVRQDGILAHMWLNLAAAHASRHFRDFYLRLRDAEASKMTQGQIIAAQRLAVEFTPRP
jgi:uncharacterized protein